MEQKGYPELGQHFLCARCEALTVCCCLSPLACSAIALDTRSSDSSARSPSAKSGGTGALTSPSSRPRECCLIPATFKRRSARSLPLSGLDQSMGEWGERRCQRWRSRWKWRRSGRRPRRGSVSRLSILWVRPTPQQVTCVWVAKPVGGPHDSRLTKPCQAGRDPTLEI